jgi:hypothetical protein
MNKHSLKEKITTREEVETKVDDKEISKAKKLLEANGYVVEKKPLSLVEKFIESQKYDDDCADNNDNFEDEDSDTLDDTEDDDEE